MLVLGQRAGLSDAYEIADACGFFLVVRLNLLVRAHDLAVQGVLLAVFQLDNDGLGHLVGYYVAGANLRSALDLLLLRSRCLLGISHVSLTHD